MGGAQEGITYGGEEVIGEKVQRRAPVRADIDISADFGAGAHHEQVKTLHSFPKRKVFGAGIGQIFDAAQNRSLWRLQSPAPLSMAHFQG